MIGRLARLYFAGQAIAATAWWIGVYASDGIRSSTLGAVDPTWLVGPDLVLFVGGSAVVALTGRKAPAAVVVGWSILVTLALIAYATVARAAGWGAVLMSLASAGSIAAALLLWLGRVPSERLLIGPFAFRVAPDRARSRNVASSLGQLVFFWSFFLIALPLALSWIENRWRIGWRWLAEQDLIGAGIVVFGIGSAIGLWSCLTMAIRGRGTPLPSVTARTLVVAGPYRWVRNPMAVAGALQTVGVGLWTGSWTVIAAAIAGSFVWHWLIRPPEEADLLARFGTDYDSYRRHVRCWIPITRT